MEKIYAIVVAAGNSLRFGANKQTVTIKGKSVLRRTLESLQRHKQVDEVILVLNKQLSKVRYSKDFSKIKKVVMGGRKRQDSVVAGFRMIEPAQEALVLVHDGARPLVKHDLISRIISAAREHGAAVPALPIQDTVKSAAGDVVSKTLDRTRLWRCQTPQGFRYSILKPALEEALKQGYYSTDEASLVERIGGKVKIVPGDNTNIKITFPEDIKIAEAFVED